MYDNSSETEEYDFDELSDTTDVHEGGDDDEDEEVNDPSLQGTSTHPQVPTWELKYRSQKIISDFTSETGPSNELLELEENTPIAVFLTMFRDVLMDHIVFETIYATQGGKPFSPLSLEELYAFIGINLLMGIKKLPSYRDYWANEDALHDEFIRLYKVRPFLNYLSESFLNGRHPSENQSIDESMIKFKGRSSIKHYMPKNPIKRGFKVWMRCNENGYASQFEIYSGKKEAVDKNLGEHVMKRLTECPRGKNHRVFMDNFFTTYELFKFLETKNIYSCGTFILNRKNLPRSLLAQDKNLERGEFDWAVAAIAVYE